jgi:hypothetical protein
LPGSFGNIREERLHRGTWSPEDGTGNTEASQNSREKVIT